jgi:hypothetical protein
MTRLAAAAKFLGEDKAIVEYMPGDELCLALLRKAAERGMWPLLQCKGSDHHKKWVCIMDEADPGVGPTPLDAVLAAVAAMEGE